MHNNRAACKVPLLSAKWSRPAILKYPVEAARARERDRDQTVTMESNQYKIKTVCTALHIVLIVRAFTGRARCMEL